MTTEPSGLDATWAAWADALVATLFPAGLGPGQGFAFGQTTLVADFANSDAEVINAEIFRIGDTVPAPGPNFAPLASLSQAYGYFLQRQDPATVTTALGYWRQASSEGPTPFNMPTRLAAQVPAGMGPPGPPAPTVYQPAYQLDGGFPAKYGEWQQASVQGRTTAGGVIRVQSAAARAAPRVALMSAVRPMPAAPFLRLRTGSTGLARLAAAPSVGPGGSGVTDGYGVAVAFTGLGTFTLNPLGWFSDTTVRMLADQLSPADQARFFGRAGVLGRRIYQVVLGFQPSVTVSFQAPVDRDRAKALLAAGGGGGLGVGPLSFDGTAAATSDGGDGSTITLGPTASSLPILLGVVSTALSDLVPAAQPSMQPDAAPAPSPGRGAMT